MKDNNIVHKDIVGYEGRYEVTLDGRVWSVISNRYLKYDYHQGFGSKTYLRATVVDAEGNRKNKRVHRLVAEAFLDNPEGKAEVNHLDGNTLNNTILNLQWTASDENLEHSYVAGLMTRPNKIVQETLDGAFVAIYSQMKEVIKLNPSYNKKAIGMVCNPNNKDKTHKGYVWKYLK